jgi:hypothetical protein
VTPANNRRKIKKATPQKQILRGGKFKRTPPHEYCLHEQRVSAEFNLGTVMGTKNCPFLATILGLRNNVVDYAAIF